MKQKEAFKTLFKKEVIKGVQVIRLPLYPDHSQRAINRALNYISFMLSAILLGTWHIKKPDVFWIYTPFSVLPAVLYKFIFKKNFVLEIADLWPDTIEATGMIRKGKVTQLLEYLANFGYEQSAAITVQNPGFETTLIERNVPDNKLHIVENWANENIYFPIEYDQALADSINVTGKFNIMFAGNIGIAQGIDNIINAAAECEDVPDIRFIIVGGGNCLDLAKKQVDELNIHNVVFVERQPANVMARYFSIADLLLVSLVDKPLFAITLPAKTQSYLACGKPVLIVKRGIDAEFLQEQGCAIQCDPENPELLANKIKELRELPIEKREQMGKLALTVFRENYSKDMLVTRMEKVLIDAGSN